MPTRLNSTHSHLYDRDYYLWLQTTLEQIKTGKLEQVDWVNLIAEIEDMSRRERKAIFSNLKILLMHLLKYQHQPEKRSNSWLFTILEHRQRILEDLEISPSLGNYLVECYPKSYQNARKLASVETGLSLSHFPELSPFTLEETLNPEYLPAGD